MIVEFIGSSGAGKTTIAGALRNRMGVSRHVLPATALYLDRPGVRRIRHPVAANIVADITAIGPFLRRMSEHRAFIDFAFETLRRHAPSRIAKYNYMRNVVRAVGIHELARRRGDDSIVLADEGTVLTAYLLFVYTRGSFDEAQLDEFSRLVPLPDRVVYVRAPVDALVRRALERPDPRRELLGTSPDGVRGWITRAVSVFDSLANSPALRDRTVVVDNPDGSAGVPPEATVSQIALHVTRPLPERARVG